MLLLRPFVFAALFCTRMISWNVVYARNVASLPQRPFHVSSLLRRRNSNSIALPSLAECCRYRYNFRSFVSTTKRSQHQHSQGNLVKRRPTPTLSSFALAFIRPVTYAKDSRQQRRQQSSQYKKKSFWKPPSIGSVLASVTAAAILYNDSNKENVTNSSYSVRKTSMTLCNTNDPNDSNNNIQNPEDGVATSSSASSRNEEKEPSQQPFYFSPDCLEYDHYSGVTINLECIHDTHNDDDDEESNDASLTFAERLEQQLRLWKAEGIIRGVWIHIPPQLAAYVPTCIQQGFDFHMVTPSATTTNDSDIMGNDNIRSTGSNSILILSQWLPDSTSRLPVGPTHQVGVGCLIWHPEDSPMLGPQRRILVVQEKSGPAATFRLWKLPTGLADPNEDIHDAAIRELYEETGLVGQFDGLLLVRQAHPNVLPTTPNITIGASSGSTSKAMTTDVGNTKRNPKSSSVQRKISDLFFICQLSIPQQEQLQSDSSSVNDDEPIWTACPNEIAAIQWMTVQDYCNQQRWQSSPLYMELNRVILESASTSIPRTLSNDATVMLLWNDTTLPVWLDGNDTALYQESKNQIPVPVYTNTFYSVK